MEFSDITPLVVGDFTLKLVLLFLILFFALLVHELGHFFAARIFGINVKSVEIGRGRKLLERTDKHGTNWRLGLIPFGAFVNLDASEGGSFFARPYWQRVVTIIAGPAVNLLLPFILIPLFFIAIGQPSGPPVVAGVGRDLPAGEAQMKPWDRILKVNGKPVRNFQDIWQEAYTNGAIETLFTVQREENGQVQEFDTMITPLWAEYVDDNIKRANPRFGMIFSHVPFRLESIKAIDGENVLNKPDRAREIFTAKMGQTVSVDLKEPDKNEDFIYDFLLNAEANPNLNKKGHRDYKLIYLGRTRDNFYLKQPVIEQFYDGIHYAWARIGKVISLPFQLLPLDPYSVRDENAVSDYNSYWTNMFYKFVHNIALASIFIGLINLLPLPYLDGGHILTQGIEAARRRPMSRKSKAWLFTASFLTLYLSVLAANFDNVPGYIDSRLKKVHEFINKNHPEEEVKDEKEQDPHERPQVHKRSRMH